MPFPTYIVCCRTVSEENGRVTFHDVIDSLIAITVPDDEEPKLLEMSVVAAWARGDGDNDQRKFDSELRIILPDGMGYVHDTQECSFGDKTRLFRIDAKLKLNIKSTRLGWMKVESRLRAKGGGDWISQTYHIALQDPSDYLKS